ncbi:MatE family transporter [Blumeria hordei DH14]|uniref:MatE family transporter n=1 Tax=Blumeria graminis f. sp. hordei (strain DH14) TaxID=546991 RepID=N1JLV3_BLUG1|nr:MatE family transporter [Blumeria hordei DH14]
MSITNSTNSQLTRPQNSLPFTSSHPDERTSLLPPRLNTTTNRDEVDHQHVSSRRSSLAEFVILLRGSVPVILAYSLQNSLQTVSVLIVGRLSPEALATSAFSYMFAMSTAWLVAFGGTTALDTLASSTFTGSKDPHDVGILLQRAFIVLTALYIPVAILWAFSAPIFRLLGQEEYICIDSAKFLTALIPGGFGFIYFEALKKYLQAQAIMHPGTYVLLITSPVSAGLNYLFVHTFNFGLLGAPIATGIAYWLSFFLLLLYTKFISNSRGWGGWSWECLHISTFARLAILGTVHVGTEWWAFAIVAFAAGRLGTVSLAAQSIIMTTDQVMNTIPLGFSVATSARVGNLLGARNAVGAARAVRVSAYLSIFVGTIVLAFLMAVKNVYGKLFNDDAAVIKLTAEIMPWVAMFQIADGLAGSCGGSLRGMGKQHIGAIVNIIIYYFGALPLGIWLAFNGWGLVGLWIGQCMALYLVGIIESIILAASNWEQQVDKAFERMGYGKATGEAGESLLDES